jgi:hypothetical protein
MAMMMTGEQLLAAPRESVWAKLNDAEILRVCIPGCESLDAVRGNEFQAVATTKVGPIKARFKGTVRLTELDPPNGYTISGEGGDAWLQRRLDYRAVRLNVPLLTFERNV